MEFFRGRQIYKTYNSMMSQAYFSQDTAIFGFSRKHRHQARLAARLGNLRSESIFVDTQAVWQLYREKRNTSIIFSLMPLPRPCITLR